MPFLAAALLSWPGAASPGWADAPKAPTTSPAVRTPALPDPEPADYDHDLDLDRAEPDFTLIDLPTNLRLPRHGFAFRLTHRFARSLGEGDLSDLLADFFGFDGGAQIGLGLRFGLFRGTQLGLYRTSDRTIQIHAQQELAGQDGSPVGLSLVASVEGLNNFGLTDVPAEPLHEFSPSIAVVVSRKLGTRAAFYVVPSWVGGTRTLASAPGDDDSTLVLGLGARVRLTETLAVVGEVHPRLAGYAGDLGSGDPDPLAAFGLEWRVGGHAFQLNFQNALGTTPAQVARGAQGLEGWFIGFNLTRKFF
jgi:hypothetical protein